MRRILAARSVWNRFPFPNRFNLHPTRPFCSASRNSKPTTTNGGGGGSNNCSSSSLSNYNEQYKALENLDFEKAAKIIADAPKKKFGWDFHLVQLVIVCLPSLAVYLVAQYARGEMRKMDVELERKKQAEFEAHAKEMELKAAEDRATVASNPALLEMKERLEKLEQTIKEIIVESKNQSNDAIKEGREDSDEQKKAAEVEPDNTHISQSNRKDGKK